MNVRRYRAQHHQGRHAADEYRLRLHRARSVVLTGSELVEIRAAQRTFEGAYIRTAIGQFSFALIVLKIFTAEFYSIGALFAVYGTGIMFISLFRRQQGTSRSPNTRRRLMQTDRKQAVLLRTWRRRAAPQEVPNQWECGCGHDGAQCLSVCLSARACAATRDVSWDAVWSDVSGPPDPAQAAGSVLVARLLGDGRRIKI